MVCVLLLTMDDPLILILKNFTSFSFHMFSQVSQSEKEPNLGQSLSV
jgi:hypothetical protein